MAQGGHDQGAGVTALTRRQGAERRARQGVVEPGPAGQGRGSGGWKFPARKSAVSAPAVARAPTKPSSSDVLANRFAPCRPVHAVSPIAFRFCTLVRPERSVWIPPQE